MRKLAIRMHKYEIKKIKKEQDDSSEIVLHDVELNISKTISFLYRPNAQLFYKLILFQKS